MKSKKQEQGERVKTSEGEAEVLLLSKQQGGEFPVLRVAQLSSWGRGELESLSDSVKLKDSSSSQGRVAADAHFSVLICMCGMQGTREFT